MYVYLNIYNIIPPRTKRKTLAPTAPISGSMFVSGCFDTTKSKVFYIKKKKQEESVVKIERQQVLLSKTNYLQL